MSIKITMDKMSEKQMLNNLTVMRSTVINSAQEGIETIGSGIINIADATCPENSGALKASIYKESEVDSNNVNCNVGYGGHYAKINPKTQESTDEYSIEVHEDLSGNSAKWFEKAFNTASEDADNVLVEIIRAALGG